MGKQSISTKNGKKGGKKSKFGAAKSMASSALSAYMGPTKLEMYTMLQTNTPIKNRHDVTIDHGRNKKTCCAVFSSCPCCCDCCKICCDPCASYGMCCCFNSCFNCTNLTCCSICFCLDPGCWCINMWCNGYICPDPCPSCLTCFSCCGKSINGICSSICCLSRMAANMAASMGLNAATGGAYGVTKNIYQAGKLANAANNYRKAHKTLHE